MRISKAITKPREVCVTMSALVAFVAVFLVVAAQGAYAAPVSYANPAVSFTTPTIDFSNFTDLDGWQFTVNNNITVDSLGFYDDPAVGITTSHPVGIYDVATQALVLSGSVGPTDPYSNWFNWASVSPTVLLAGHTYDIVAIVGNDPRTWNPVGIAFNPDVAYVMNVWSNNYSTLHFPDSTDGNPYGYFGPNFDIQTSSPVPEPSMLLLVGTGLMGVLGVTRRKMTK